MLNNSVPHANQVLGGSCMNREMLDTRSFTFRQKKLPGLFTNCGFGRVKRFLSLFGSMLSLANTLLQKTH